MEGMTWEYSQPANKIILFFYEILSASIDLCNIIHY